MTTPECPAATPREQLASALLVHLGPPFEGGHISGEERQKLTSLIRAALAEKDGEIDELKSEMVEAVNERNVAETKLAEAQALNLALREALENLTEFAEQEFVKSYQGADNVCHHPNCGEAGGHLSWCPIGLAKDALSGDGIGKYRELLQKVGELDAVWDGGLEVAPDDYTDQIIMAAVRVIDAFAALQSGEPTIKEGE